MKKTAAFREGQNVEWNWMGRKVQGTIKQSFERPVTRRFRGTTFRRNGSAEAPAYIVVSKAGAAVVKAHSELSRV